MDPENLTLKQLLSNLKVGQLWALITLVTGLIAGAFTLGYKANALVTDPKLAEKEAQLTAARMALEEASDNLKKAGSESKDAGTKERFLALYLRYLIAVRNNDDEAEQSETRKAFDDFIREHVDAEKLKLHKGGSRLATITFADGTSWEIPRELHVTMKQ